MESRVVTAVCPNPVEECFHRWISFCFVDAAISTNAANGGRTQPVAHARPLWIHRHRSCAQVHLRLPGLSSWLTLNKSENLPINHRQHIHTQGCDIHPHEQCARLDRRMFMVRIHTGVRSPQKTRSRESQ